MNQSEDKDYQEFLEIKRHAQEREEELMFDHWNNLFFNGEHIINHVSDANPEAIVLEPRKACNCAVVGYDSQYRVIYSYNKLIAVFMEFDGMSEEDAIEHFSYNTLGTFDGMDNPNKPIFMYEE